MIAYVIPTRNRHKRLAQTLDALGSLAAHDAEVVIADNDSDPPVHAEPFLESGLPVTVIRLPSNQGAAARNAAAAAADDHRRWLVMLDDDSYPVVGGLPRLLDEAPADAAAVMADIHLPGAARRESGGLPEVFVGCGVAIRREAFLDAGGYDPAFGYYAEEYDLAARLLLEGWRVAFEPRFAVHHHKVGRGRDMDLILSRLVRNNGWVVQRYAPGAKRRTLLRESRARYRRIAEREGAVRGMARGLTELRRTVRAQRRTPMPDDLFDRFTGLAHARDALRTAWDDEPFRTAAIVEPGKNEWCVRRALEEMGVKAVETDRADVLAIGTMSPGPMLDAMAAWETGGRRVVAPWRFAAEADCIPASSTDLAADPVAP